MAQAAEIAKLYDALPAHYQENGVNVAVFNDWAPDEFVDKDGKLEGWSVDLARAIQDRLGVPFHYQATSFDAVIPGLVAKRFDAGFASFGSTPERLKVLDFVPQRKIGTGFAVPASSDLKIDDVRDICGVTFAVQAGSWDDQTLTRLDKEECVAKGRPAVKFERQKDQASAELAVRSGRAQATIAADVKLAYAAKQTGALKLTSLVLAPVDSCIGVRKGDPLGKVLADALQSLVDDGTYEKIMKKWGIADDRMLKKITVITGNDS
ncbi:ABC transporter substrate-binding protein [Pararhizobium mangrovi]|uniref:ABC transporter substrate-binding protein n=2 Tax=Pararhizobium mangrovi TaxID=2590452 RepID=A0A506U8Y9_9HYPH|nr:ABC transporter substrate-binding protein [Pararhizobium mangrovi]